MLTLVVLMAYCGFLCFYIISKKIKGTIQTPYLQWLLNHQFYTKLFGVALLFAGLAASIIHQGVSTGIISYVLVITVVPCLLILLRPLGYLKRSHLIFLFLFSFFIELLF